MLLPRFAIWMVSIAAMVLGAGVVSGQDYPNKPIRIVTSSLGGNTDFAARLIAQELGASVGWQVVVVNYSTGVVAGEIVSKAPPDGYTLLVFGNALWIGPLMEKAPYDPVRDFAPITLTERSPNVLVVHPTLPVQSVKELIALAKAKPGALNYASAAIGSSSHLAGELFKAMAHVNIVRVPYKSTGLAMPDLITGQVQLTLSSTAQVAPHLKSRKLRGLAVTSIKPSTLYPDLATVAATVPGYEAVSMTAVLAPGKTPAALINRLNQEVVRVLTTAEAKERLLKTGVEAATTSPEELAAIIRSDTALWGKLIKDVGIRPD